MSRFRILHAPQNIAGQASIISRAQRSLGHKSDVLSYYSNKMMYECDINLDLNGKGKLVSAYLELKTFLRCIKDYDIFHFHFGQTLLPRHMDIPILHLLGKKVIMHYWGSDVIEFGKISDYSRLERRHVEERIKAYPDDIKAKHTRWIEANFDATIVGDYSLLPYSPKSLVVRQAIDLNNLPFIGAEWAGGPIRIVHAPTNRMLKGTEYILNAIERLKDGGANIELILVENMSNSEARKTYQSADIVIDDVLMGPYGILAIECMAMGKPVLGFIHEKFINYYINLPIVNTSPDNVYERIKELVDDPKQRAELGRSGRKYVEENHNSIVVAKSIDQIYESL